VINAATPEEVKRWTEWVELVSKIAVLIGGVLAAFWAYIKFVLEKGLLPPIEFDVACTSAGVLRERSVVEIVLRLKNAGSSTLICHNLRLDVLYILGDHDEVLLESDPQKSRFGHLLFPHSLAKEDLKLTKPIDPPIKAHVQFRPWLKQVIRPLTVTRQFIGRVRRWIRSLLYEPERSKRGERWERGLLVAPHDTFVQPAVTQGYTFVTTLPEKTTHVLIWASFQYGVRPKLLQRAILRLGRILGLIQYSLTHVNRPHTTERVFDLRRSHADATAAIQE
jgi:hypothetical protein